MDPVCDLVDPDEKDELGHEEAATQVLVDSGSGVLDVTEEPESEDAHGKTDDGDDHSQLSYPRQNVIMCDKLRKTQEKTNCIIYTDVITLHV